MKKRTKRSAKKSLQHNPLLAFVIAGLLMVALGVAGDALFADYHVAIYGSMPSVSSSDDYTPVQKSSVSSSTNRAAARAAKRTRTLRPAATSSSSLSSSSAPLIFSDIDGTRCDKGNETGACQELIHALAYDGNPACLRVETCRRKVMDANSIPECKKNNECIRAVIIGILYQDYPSCINDPTPCRKIRDQLLKTAEENIKYYKN